MLSISALCGWVKRWALVLLVGIALALIAWDQSSRDIDWRDVHISISRDLANLKLRILAFESHFHMHQAANAPTVSLLKSSLFSSLPHLAADNFTGLHTRLLAGGGRKFATLALGVPTVRRPSHSYILSTLRSLIEDAISPADSKDTVIVVLIADTDPVFVENLTKQIQTHFHEQLLSGLLEVIAPHASFYPPDLFTSSKLQWGDGLARVHWRTKQNLDVAYLMAYCHPRATLYVHLEDDIWSRAGAVATMRNAALDRTARDQPWHVLVFCQLGLIGKMFRTVDLPQIVHFLLIFYKDKPVDWLLDDLLGTKVCNQEMSQVQCKKAKAAVWISFKPSLFQHVGMHSSLPGKLQHLKDKQFGRVSLFTAHVDNPPADVHTDIKPYKQHTLDRAYVGKTFFWGLLPQQGDLLTFKFYEPTIIDSYVFRSGNVEKPEDVLRNATVEVLPSVKETTISNSKTWIEVGHFDEEGVAEGSLSSVLGPISAMRIHVHNDADHWLILSELQSNMFSFHKPKVYRSTSGCCICKAKSSSSRFTDSTKYEDDLLECFKLPERRTGEICNACVLLVKRWKKLPAGSGRHWRHVVDFRAGPGSKSLVRAKSRANNSKKPQLKAQVRAITAIGGDSPLRSDDDLLEVGESSSKVVDKARRLPRRRKTLDEDEDEEDEEDVDDEDEEELEEEVDLESDSYGFVDLNFWKRKRVCCGVIFTGPGNMVMVDPRLIKPCKSRLANGGGACAMAGNQRAAAAPSTTPATPLSDSSSDSGYDDCSNGSSVTNPTAVPSAV